MTLKELAKEIGCSRATLDRVLHNRDGVGDVRRREILERINESGYKPNKIGKMLSQQKRTAFGIILCSDATPKDNLLFDIIYQGMQEGVRELEQTGVTFRICHIKTGKAAEQIEVINELVEEGVAGIAISIEEKSEELCRVIKYHSRKGIRFVSYFNMNGMQNTEYEFACRLGIDQRREGYVAAGLMAKFLGGTGKVALISGLEKNLVHQVRVDSARELLERDYPGILPLPVIRNGYPEDEMKRLCGRLLEEHPDIRGIIASCGFVNTLLECVRARGLKEQVSIVIFDFTNQAVKNLENGCCDAVLGVDLKRLGYKTAHAVYEMVFQGEVSGDIRFVPLEVKLKESLAPI